MRKTFLETHLSCSMKKNLEKTANIRKMRAFRKWPNMTTMQRLKPMQNTQFRSKNKIA